MQLYYCPQTRSTRARWMLEEIGAPYELVRLSLRDGDQKKPEYLAIHPHGVVPALVDDGVPIFESAAICAYLADKFPETGLAPSPGTTDRGLYYQWLHYAMATMEPPVLKVFLNVRFLPEEKRDAGAAEEGRMQFAAVRDVLKAAIEGKEFLVAGRFSTADLLVGSILGWSRSVGLLEGAPELDAYATALLARPAYLRATAD